MSARTNCKRTDHSSSTFNSFLEREGIRKEVEALAIKRVLAWQVEQAIQEQHLGTLSRKVRGLDSDRDISTRNALICLVNTSL